MRLLISPSNEVRLTTLLDRTKCCCRLNQWKTNLGGWLHDKSWYVHVFIKVFEVCWSLVFKPPNGYDTFVQQTSISLKEIISLPQNRIPLSLLMKISSSHHRFGLWWLCYLCLRCLQATFLPLVETFPFLWICRCLFLVCCVERVAVIIGLGCVTSVHIAFRLPFCLW